MSKFGVAENHLLQLRRKYQTFVSLPIWFPSNADYLIPRAEL